MSTVLLSRISSYFYESFRFSNGSLFYSSHVFCIFDIQTYFNQCNQTRFAVIDNLNICHIPINAYESGFHFVSSLNFSFTSSWPGRLINKNKAATSNAKHKYLK